ncbi:MAG: PAS domain S-box protein, partial [Candidatus Neomarinimicrobiota bacterium]
GKPFVTESLLYEDVYGGKRIIKAFNIQITKLGNGFVAAWSDITERKKAEDTLNDATQRLSYHRENTPLASIEFNQNYQIIGWSDNAEKMFGWTAKEILGKKIRQMRWVHEEDLEKVEQVSADMSSGQKPSNVNTNRNYRKDGSVITCKWYNSAMMNSDGDLVSVHSMIQDITERDKAVKKLQESEEKYRTIFEGANDVFIYVNTTGHIIDVNNRIEDVLGYKKEEIIGKNFTKLGIIQPREIPSLLNQFRKSVQLGKVFSPKGKEKAVLLNVSLKRKDGQYIIVETSTQIIKENKKVSGFVTVFRDITDRLKAEETLRKKENELARAQQIANVGSWTWQKEADKSVFSDQTFRMLGYTPNEIIPTFKWLLGEMHPDDVKRVMKGIEESMSTGDPYDMEYRLKRKDQKEIIVHSQGEVVLNQASDATGMTGVIYDITERKQAEKALLESERKFRLFFENEPGYCYMVSLQGEILDVNKSALKILGYTKEEIIGKQVLNTIYAPSSRLKAKQLFTKWKETKKLKDEELIILTKDGMERTVLLSAKAITNDAGEILSSISVQRDITEYKKAEEALKTSMKTAADIVHSTPHGIFIYQYEKPDRLILLSGNPEAERMTGIKIDDWIGKENNEIWPEARKAGVTDAYLKVMKTGKTYKTEDLYYKDEKLEGAFRIRAFILPEEKLCVSFENITERKQVGKALRESETKYRSLFATVADAIIIFDPETRNIVDVNSAASNLYGYTDDEFKKLSHLDITHEPEDSLQSVRETSVGKPIFIPIRYHKKKDGTIFPVEISGSMFKLGDQKVLCGVIRDITERVLRDGELSNTFAQLRQLSSRIESIREEEAGRMSRELHDEMGQYLTAINLNLQDLTEKYKKGDKESIDKILKQTSEIVNETEAKVHELSLELRPLMLDELGLVPTFRWYIDKSFSHLKTNCVFETTKMKKRLRPDLEITFFRVMQETITNVLRHAKAMNVAINLERVNKDIIYTISDDGKGFDLQKYSTKITPEHGLGLIGIKERIQRFGGQVNIESEPKKGTTVKVIIPWKEEDSK